MLLGTIAAAVVGSAALAGLSAIGGGKLSASPAAYWAYTLVGAGVVNLGAYFVAFRILAPKDIAWRSLLPGTLIGGLGWTALEALGGLLINHVLRHTSQLFVYAGETNVVLARHLWPRHIDNPPPDPEKTRVQVSPAAS
jgi:uncharacterized BrkB/YihY/UPF0761 family membrane protein